MTIIFFVAFLLVSSAFHFIPWLFLFFFPFLSHTELLLLEHRKQFNQEIHFTMFAQAQQTTASYTFDCVDNWKIVSFRCVCVCMFRTENRKTNHKYIKSTQNTRNALCSQLTHDQLETDNSTVAGSMAEAAGCLHRSQIARTRRISSVSMDDDGEKKSEQHTKRTDETISRCK